MPQFATPPDRERQGRMRLGHLLLVRFETGDPIAGLTNCSGEALLAALALCNRFFLRAHFLFLEALFPRVVQRDKLK
jgi:hypothetical protein